MLLEIKKYINKYSMLDKCSHVIAGLSGGADSVCLFMVLEKLQKEYNYTLHAIHVHHGIRGAEADRDLEFSRQLCEKYNIDFKAVYYDVPCYAKEQGITCEEAGRQLRYKTFREYAGQFKDSVIAVAHHMNDQAETVIFNMCRGSGIRGMRGMQPVKDGIIRPLLCCTRTDIEDYLKKMGISYCTDSTNDSNDYSRNKIRHDVIPYLTENINIQTVKNIGAMADNAGEAERYLEKVTEQIFTQRAIKEKDGILLKGLDNEDAYMAKRLIRRTIDELTHSLKDIGEVHIEEVYALTKGQSGMKADIRRGLWAAAMQDGIFISKECEKESRKAVEVTVPGEICIDNCGKKFTFELIEWNNAEKISNEVYTKCFDYDKIKFGLQLRGRQPKDTIAIDGNGHHKKLKQYFIDEKIPVRNRDEAILLADGNHILWIVGMRIGADYKVTNTTKTVLKVNYGGQSNGKS